jgi:hypothetical protein
MRIYVFKSSSTARLRAFAGDPDINNLPRQHGPWVITGAIAPGATPPSHARPLKRRSPCRDFSFGVCAKVPSPARSIALNRNQKRKAKGGQGIGRGDNDLGVAAVLFDNNNRAVYFTASGQFPHT